MDLDKELVMQKEYRTVLNRAAVEMEEKKSKFIASVKPVSNEEEALDFINSVRTEYYDSSHNVYAYRIGGDNIAQRYSDDGEPSGTAGLPVLEVIRKMELQDIALVVTRYFGGVPLGAAGLARAYGKCASMGIEAARIVKKSLCSEIGVVVEYELAGRVHSVIARRGYPTGKPIYGQDVEITAFVPVDEVEAFCGIVNGASKGRAIVDIKGNVYIILES